MIRFLLISVIFLSSLSAKEYKAIFDCSSSDAQYIKSRMWLIEKTKSMIEKSGNKATFAITLHGSCVAMVSSFYEAIVPDEDMSNIKKAQEYLKALATEHNVTVKVCAMSLVSNAIDKEDVLKFVTIVPNSFIDTIGYQNDGYALMTFK